MTAGVELEETASWRCWCSTDNTACSSSCTTCTAPRTTTIAADKVDSEPVLVDDDDDDDTGRVAPMIALIVRGDLELGVGKVAEQCCLATLCAAWRDVQDVRSSLPLLEWTKAVLVCRDLAALSKTEGRAAVCGLPTVCFGDRTVLAIGPSTAEQLAIVTDHLETFQWNVMDGALQVEGQGFHDNDTLTERREESVLLLARLRTENPVSAGKGKGATTAPEKKKKLKPNDKCGCGSEKKFKKCCGNKPAICDTDLKDVPVPLKDLVVALLGEDAQQANHGATNNAGGVKSVEPGEYRGPANGEKVLGFRKQVEYGAKKYIKP